MNELEVWSKLPTIWENGARNKKFSGAVPGHYNSYLIGSGSFGKVLKVKDENGQLFAIKAIPNSDVDAGPAVAKEILYSEVLSTSKHFVKVVDYFLVFMGSVQFYWIAMELCDGNLKSYCELNSIPEPTLIDWMITLCGALIELDKHNLVHMDIKLSNVLKKGEDLKISDFGITRALHQFSQKENTITWHSAPELHRGDKASTASDIYSLGVLFYQIITKKLEENTEVALSDLDKETQYNRFIIDLVKSMLSKDPNARPRLSDLQIRLLALKATGNIPNLLSDKNAGNPPKELKSNRADKVKEWNTPAFDEKGFVERKELQDQLIDAISTSNSRVVTLVAYSGLGGIGKTSLAKYYFFSEPSNQFKLKLWINVPQIDIEYRNFAEDFGLITRDEKIDTSSITRRVSNWLQRNPGWLIVYDSAENMEQIEPYLPKHGGNILITSRNPNWENNFVIEVKVLSEEESIVLIRKNSGIKEGQDEDIKELSKELGYLPLALAHASAYIKMSRCKVKDYLKLFKEKKGKILKEKRGKLESLQATWSIDMEKLIETCPQAITLLQHLSFFHNENIPRRLIPPLLTQCGVEDPDEMEVTNILVALENYSLIQVSGETFISIHKLVQQVIILDLEKEQEIKLLHQSQYITSLSHIQKPSTKRQFAWNKSLVSHLEALVSNYQIIQDFNLDQIVVYIKTLGALGVSFSMIGNPFKMKEFCEKALSIQESHFGKDHFQVSITLSNLGTAYGSLGNHHKKKELLERALSIQESHYGKDHIQVAVTLTNLGTAYGSLGNPHKMKELLERALSIEESHFGRNHFEVSIILTNLANAYGFLGNPHKKKELLERALFLQESHFGKDHFEAAIILTNLGTAYGSLGNHHKKKELLERALLIQESYYGKDHFEIAITSSNLGNAYGFLGNPEKMKELLERALSIQECHYGRDHFEVAITVSNLGNAYGYLGNHLKKKELLERALLIQESYYGKDHFEIASTLTDLGAAYGSLGNHHKTKELLERSLSIQESHYGKEYFRIAITLSNLGTAYGSLGNHHKMKELLERALSIEESHYGKDHFEVANTLSNLGTVYGSLGNYQKTQELLERALSIQESHYGKDHFEIARTLTNLGNAYGYLGNPHKMKELLERALSIKESHYGKESFEVAVTKTNLGAVTIHLNNLKLAKQHLSGAFHTFSRINHPHKSQVFQQLAALTATEFYFFLKSKAT